MTWLMQEQWSPYTVGMGIGILCCLAFFLSNRPLGCSTAFARSSGMIERFIRGSQVLDRIYYQKFAPVVDWQWMLVLGIVVGAFLSALLGGVFQVQWVPAKWAETFGPNPALRWIAALVGGFFMGLGARWAGGCTSGHGISGALQLAVSSWLAAICFFLGGIVTAQGIFRVLPGWFGG